MLVSKTKLSTCLAVRKRPPLIIGVITHRAVKIKVFSVIYETILQSSRSVEHTHEASRGYEKGPGSQILNTRISEFQLGM